MEEVTALVWNPQTCLSMWYFFFIHKWSNYSSSLLVNGGRILSLRFN